jgi:hypothetical protein
MVKFSLAPASVRCSGLHQPPDNLATTARPACMGPVAVTLKHTRDASGIVGRGLALFHTQQYALGRQPRYTV